MGLLDGKKGLIYGVRNRMSIAWGCAQSAAREGASFALTYFGEREEADVKKLAATLPEGTVFLIEPCDLNDAEQVAALHAKLAPLGTLDFMIHAVAYARGLEGRFVDVSYPDFEISLRSSSYTLVAAARAIEPLMSPEGGSIVTLTYIGGERVIPNYNAAGISKAALESCVRYIAKDLGPQKIRVNAISAGPVKTLSSKGIAEFGKMYKAVGEVAPLGKATDKEEVGDVCAFLLSNLSRAMTGDVIFVDSGYHALGFYSTDTTEAE